MTKNIIYFDNASTTRANEEVLKTYMMVNEGYYANASSVHILGIKANDLKEKAREQILSLLNLSSTHEVIFTSGATEANNLALKGYAHKYRNRGNHIIVSSIEHPSVLESARQLEEEGFEVTYLPVNEKGKVELESLKKAIKKETILVSIMALNNETGMDQGIEEIASFLKDYPKIMLHTDAVQAIGKADINYQDVDMITISSHKIHGLKGIGALLKRKAITFYPLLSGGGQEDNNRSGTYDLPSIVSFAKALRLELESFKKNFMYVKTLHDKLLAYFVENEGMYTLNSFSNNPYILNVSLKEKKAAVIVEGLSKEGIMISSISACNSKREASSYVVYEMSHDEKRSHNTLRISLSYENTLEEVDIFINIVDKLVRGIRR